MLGRLIDAAPDAAQVRRRNDTPHSLVRQYTCMIENHVSREIADQVVDAVRSRLTLGQLADETLVHDAVLSELAGFFPISDTSLAPARGSSSRPFTLALVGPTGVGKTTTIAKLAATYTLAQSLRVGLITTDTYRIAAVEQLATYAEIIGVPLKVVTSAAEMREAMESYADLDVVLIDTAGRSPKDTARLEELRTLLDAAHPTETHLVLSGASSEPVLIEAARRFAVLGTDRVIFTKLDEAVTYGVILNVASRVGARLSFITTGQEVPDQIEAPHPDRLARLMLQPSLAA